MSRPTPRQIAYLMLVEAASLAVASSLHLAGLVHGRGKAFDSTDAGIAEAVIGVVLAGAGWSMLRRAATARAVGLAATAFAIAGFGVGLSITLPSGHIPDIAYHLTVLPLLVAGFVVLWRLPAAQL
jgi:hypothetical protein